MRKVARVLTFALLFFLGAQARVEAQAGDSIRERFYIPLAPTIEVPARGRLVAPAISLGLPTGYGAGSGNASFGFGIQSRHRDTDGAMDGVLFGGFGLGSPRRAVGLEVLVLSYGTVRSCCRGGVSTKLHRVLPFSTAVAVGAENLVTWTAGSYEGRASDVPRSYYGVATKVFHFRETDDDPFSALTVSVGAGNGRFASVDDLMSRRDRWRPFGAASLRVIEPVSVLAEWSARPDLAAGLSVTPLRNRPLIITPAVVDLRTDPRFTLSVGYGFAYALPF